MLSEQLAIGMHQGHGAVFCHDGVNRPAGCKGLTSAHGAAGDGHQVQACGLQIGQGTHGGSVGRTQRQTRVLSQGVKVDFREALLRQPHVVG